MEIFSLTYFSLFLIIALGYILGRIKVRGISLDISAVIFIALVFGHYGVVIPSEFQNVGLVLFIYTVGLQSGPGFIRSFRSTGAPLVTVAILLISTAALMTIFTAWLFDLDFKMAVGLFTGALTSTPGLAAAIDATGSSLAPIGYSIAYPVGVIGVILFVKFLPVMLNVKVKKAEKDMDRQFMEQYPEITTNHFIVENDSIAGKSIGELGIRSMTGASISRVESYGNAITPSPGTILHRGDLIRAVGSKESLEKVHLLVGSPTDRQISLGDYYDVQSILVTRRDIVNKTIGQLNLFKNYNATITRVRRSGIDISPDENFHINLGDKLLVASNKDSMKAVAKLFGNQEKKLSDTNIFPIAAGIVLGTLVGQISIRFTGNIDFSPGLAGGVLLVAIILGNIGKTGPIIWSMSPGAGQLLRQIGLLFFLATVGTQAGETLVDTIRGYGATPFIAGVIITLVPMFVSALFAHYYLKINLLSLFGTITGGMTSTPGLAVIDTMTDSNAPQLAYATVYPAAMVILIIFVQILGQF